MGSSSPTRDQTQAPCIGAQNLSHWPRPPVKSLRSLFFFFKESFFKYFRILWSSVSSRVWAVQHSLEESMEEVIAISAGLISQLAFDSCFWGWCYMCLSHHLAVSTPQPLVPRLSESAALWSQGFSYACYGTIPKFWVGTWQAMVTAPHLLSALASRRCRPIFGWRELEMWETEHLCISEVWLVWGRWACCGRRQTRTWSRIPGVLPACTHTCLGEEPEAETWAWEESSEGANSLCKGVELENILGQLPSWAVGSGAVWKLCLLLFCCSVVSNSFWHHGLPVLHYLPEFAQTHLLWVGDAIQPSILCRPLLLLTLNLSQHQGLSQWVGFSHQVAKVVELQHQSFQGNQDWFPLGLTGLISLQIKGLSSLL